MFGGITIFVLGLVFGSFLNALQYRLSKNKKITGRSFCPNCKKTLSPLELIPLVSFIVQKGQCRGCGKKISWQYPLVELLTGLVFFLVGWKSGLNAALNELVQMGVSGFSLKDMLLAFLLFAIAFILILLALHDLKTKYLLTKWVYAGVGLSIIYNILAFSGTYYSKDFAYWLFNLALAAFIPALLFFLVAWYSKERFMGKGDADLALFTGFFLGWPLVSVSYYFAFIAGAVWGVALIFSRKAKMKSEIPFGPFLISGIFFSWFLGEQIISWYAKIILGS